MPALRWILATLACLLAIVPAAGASVVERGYVPLPDGTQLHYTLTLPKAEGRFPVVLQYDPYAAGATSDPTWNDSGYAMLGVNFRGTGCSNGRFDPGRGDVWGRDGAAVIDWAARQPWSDGNLAMLGYSFTGTSQLATAAYAGPALKAIMPGNVFPDMYRDLVYPGGIYNSWLATWLLAGRQLVVGAAAVPQALTDLGCLASTVAQVTTSVLQSGDPGLHGTRDDFWDRTPITMTDRVRIPILGCVNWQDTTVYSRSFNTFRDRYDPATTWVVGGNGAHSDCPISRARRVRFLDHYLRHRDNGWPSTPHLLLVHEATAAPERDKVPAGTAGWESSFRSWGDVSAAIVPQRLYLRAGGRLDVAAPTRPEPADDYAYGAATANTPPDWLGVSAWNRHAAAGGQATYTSARLARDAEFLGSGSGDLWVASTATDSDLQLTLSEIRPDGQETFVQNGWLRLSHRALDGPRSTVLRPLHSDLRSDLRQLTPGVPVLARIELQPFDHVFRAGSAIRLAVDTPGGWLSILPGTATNSVQHAPGMASALTLGRVRGGRSEAPLPACGTLLNQPCRPAAGTVPSGVLDLPEPPLPAAATAPAARVTTLLLGRPTARPGRHPALRVAVRAAGGRVRQLRLLLRDARGRRIAASRRLSVGARPRAVLLPLRHRLGGGRYVVRASGRTADGRAVAAQRPVQLRGG